MPDPTKTDTKPKHPLLSHVHSASIPAKGAIAEFIVKYTIASSAEGYALTQATGVERAKLAAQLLLDHVEDWTLGKTNRDSEAYPVNRATVESLPFFLTDYLTHKILGH